MYLILLRLSLEKCTKLCAIIEPQGQHRTSWDARQSDEVQRLAEAATLGKPLQILHRFTQLQDALTRLIVAGIVELVEVLRSPAEASRLHGEPAQL